VLPQEESVHGLTITFELQSSEPPSAFLDESSNMNFRLRAHGISIELNKSECRYVFKNDILAIWQGESGCAPPIMRNISSISEVLDLTHMEVRGLFIILNTRTKEIKIKNDLFGSFPLYYSHPNEEKLIISSLSTNIARTTPDHFAFDSLGVYQFLCGAYTVGNRTLQKAVHRLPPASIFEGVFNGNETRIKVSRYQNIWKTSNEVRLNNCIVEQLAEAFKQEGRALHDCLLMFSAGWDSRLIAASLWSAGTLLSAHAYSHGDLKSREISIAQAMSQELNIQHTLTQLDGSEAKEDIIGTSLQVNESAMFPHWALAAKLNRSACNTVTGGIFGGFLGGHYGTTSILPPSKAKRQLFAYLSGIKPYEPKTKEECIDLVSSLLSPHSPGEFWCFSKEFNERLKDENIKTAFMHDIEHQILSYFNEGTTDAERLTERYLVEHKGAQHMNSQLRAVSPYCRYRNPYTNTTVSAIAGALDPRDKIHNKAHQRILMKLDKRLLKYPMAATLLDASKPIWAQELSRGVRKLAEHNRTISVLRERLGRYPNRSLGWNNFEHLRNREFLDIACRDLTNPIWDVENIKATVLKRTDIDMYSFFDMLCKIKTIQYRVNAQN
jgi:hypothetical protein